MSPRTIIFRYLLLFMGIICCASAETISYNRDIRPILSDNCFACHGFDLKKRKADLRLDTFEGATADNDGVTAIVPGSVEKSELWQRIHSADEDEVMPPPKTHKTISAEQKVKLRKWIEQGAPYEKHWSFVPPVAAIPAVKQTAWPRNPIDHFVLAQLEEKGLKPSSEAVKEALIRRVTLDLTGLPPTLPEIDAFLTDTSQDGYEKVVDRLLASPHFGERMAVDWLDAARYADTNGFQVDRDREIWAWRDWVIGAFNRNLPFDQFTIEQLAGDLLPNPTLDQIIATGFSRNTMLNEEGAIDIEEFLNEYASDRAETTVAVWLAQTLNCCRCHDHKYDPLTARDFYSMKAFFNNVPELGAAHRRSSCPRRRSRRRSRSSVPKSPSHSKFKPHRRLLGKLSPPHYLRQPAVPHWRSSRMARFSPAAIIRPKRLTRSLPRSLWEQSPQSGWKRCPTIRYQPAVRDAP